MSFATAIRRAAMQSVSRSRMYTTPAQVQQQVKEKAAPKVGKLKELAQKYGAASVLVYLGVGAVDLGVAFGAIQWIGQDQVKRLEDDVMRTVNKYLNRTPAATAEQQDESSSNSSSSIEQDGKQVQQPEQPSLASVFLLAYGIHKTLFLPFRVTVTAAITPAFVRKIHQLGWHRYAPRLFGAAGAASSKKP